jgi:LemA protein
LPAALFANSMGFAPQEFFSLDAGEKQAVEEPPTVKF